MAPRELVSWTVVDELLNPKGQGGGWTEVGFGAVASFVFIVVMTVITLLSCACCSKEDKPSGQGQGQANDAGKATASAGGSEKDNSKIQGKGPHPTASVDSSAAVGFTSATRDSSKRQSSIRQAMPPKGNIAATGVSSIGLPVTAKTPVSSQQAPATTLHAAPAFTDFVNESKK